MKAFQVDRRWLLVAVALIVVELAVLALVGQLVPERTTETSDQAQSPYQQLQAQVRPDGSVSKETALEAFALAIAPLPGVTPPSGAKPQLYEQIDGTFAVDWLLPYLDQLTPNQQAAVNAALAADPKAPVVSPEPAGVPFVVAADASDTLNDMILLHDARQAEALNLGLTLSTDSFEYRLSVNATQQDEKDSLAYSTEGQRIVDGTPKLVCDIHVNPSLVSLSQTDPLTTKASLAHEMFHCFQMDHLAGRPRPPAWIREGQAAWVGETIAGLTPIGAKWWEGYLQSPTSSLYARIYSAVGFYIHLAEKGINPWKVMFPMLDAADNDAAVKAAGGTADAFLDTWSSGLFRDASLGADWNAQGYSSALIARADALWPQPVEDTRLPITVNDGTIEAVSAAKVTNTLINLTPLADVIVTKISGHARLKTGSLDDIGLQERFYCTSSEKCTCPPGQTWFGPASMEFMPRGGLSEVALTGGLDAASGAIVGLSVTDFCREIQCKTACPSSNGDPHLRTSNDYKYDFQAAGEFTLLRSKDGSIEIQARQVPWTGEFFQGVATNTAIAARVAGHRVGVYAAAGTGAQILKVDGQVTSASTPVDLRSGASVRSYQNGFEVDFPDGSVLWTLSVGEWGINAVLQPSDALRAGGTGLLGPITPGGMGVPALPDGTQLPAAPDKHTRFVTLYGQFADAWRVTDASSLFDYDAGTSTATFTDRSFPTEQQALALESFPPDQSAAGETACAAVSDADLHSDCVFDVAATGDAGFAQGYATEQNLFDGGIVPVGPTQAPAPSGGMAGAIKVADARNVIGAAVAPDGTVDLSIERVDSSTAMIAINPRTGAVLKEVDEPTATDLHFANGSMWAAGLGQDADGHHCLLTQFDPVALAVQGTYPLACTSGYPGPRIVSTGDALWVVDTSKVDPATGSGAVLARLDPGTHLPRRSVPLGYTAGCCAEGQGALFCFCGQGLSRLLDADSAFVNLGDYNPIYPAGTGVWAEQNGSAVFVDGPSGPSTVFPIPDGRLVGGDPRGVYVESGISPTNLLRQSVDGSAPVKIASAPIFGSGIDETDLDYLSGSAAKFSLQDGFATIWVFQKALYLQWAPLP